MGLNDVGLRQGSGLVDPAAEGCSHSKGSSPKGPKRGGRRPCCPQASASLPSPSKARAVSPKSTPVSVSLPEPDVSGDGFQQLPPASQAPIAPEVPVQDGLQFSRSGPISFVTWAAGLHLTVFASRTPFASCLKRTLHLSWTGSSPPADVLLSLFQVRVPVRVTRQHAVGCSTQW